jgi:hypothetical protein
LAEYGVGIDRNTEAPVGRAEGPTPNAKGKAGFNLLALSIQHFFGV